MFLTAIICSPLDSLLNGRIVYDPQPLPDGSLSNGTVATHNCDSGHMLVGSSTRTCTGDGSSIMGYFDEEEPFCRGLSIILIKSVECLHTIQKLVDFPLGNHLHGFRFWLHAINCFYILNVQQNTYRSTYTHTQRSPVLSWS